MSNTNTDTLAPNALRYLADAYLRAAGDASPEHRFGPRKVFLCAVADVLDPDEVATLVDLHRKGLIVLSRADLVGAMDPKLVSASELNVAGYAQFHFICLA